MRGKNDKLSCAPDGRTEGGEEEGDDGDGVEEGEACEDEMKDKEGASEVKAWRKARATPSATSITNLGKTLKPQNWAAWAIDSEANR